MSPPRPSFAVDKAEGRGWSELGRALAMLAAARAPIPEREREWVRDVACTVAALAVVDALEHPEDARPVARQRGRLRKVPTRTGWARSWSRWHRREPTA